MAISSPGIGSGLDVNSIVSQLSAVERAPIAKLKAAASKIDSQVSIYGKIQSNLSTLRDAAKSIASTQTWGGTLVASSNAAAVTGSTGPGVVPGNYSVEVSQLAAVQSNATGSYQPTTPFSAQGTLKISLGTWSADQSTFTAKSATPISIDVGPPAQTLDQLRDIINKAGAGVVASVLTDVSGGRLVVSSQSTGASNGFRIEVIDSDGTNSDSSGLSALAFDPQKAISTMPRVLAAANSKAIINGVAIESEGNTLSNVVDGLTLNLTQKTSTPVTITTTSDTASMRKSVDAFVTAYNDINMYLAEQTKVEVGKSAGLQGDSAAVSIRAALRNLMGGTNGTPGAFGRLNQVGLELGKDGSIAVDSAKLDKALSQPANVKTLFASTDATVAGNDGFAVRVGKLTDSLLKSDGLVSTRKSALQSRIKSNSEQQDRLSLRADMVEKRLRAQYTALDKQLGQLNGTSNYVTQQLNAFNSKNNY